MTTHHYSADHDSPENKAFVAAFEKANNGMRPNFMAVGAYDGMALVYKALEKTKGDASGDALIGAMKGMSWMSPRGPVSIDPETRDIVQNIYVRKVEKKDGALYNVEFETIPEREGPVQGGEALTATAGDGAGTEMLTILFDGVAYGMLLFVLASGLSVTLGLMNFINLAHGAFAMVGGYVTALMMNRAGRPVPRHPAGRLHRPGDPRRGARAHALPPALRRDARSIRCCSPSASS